MRSIHKAASLLSVTVIAPDSLSYPQQRSVSKKGAECTRKTWAVGDKKVRLVFAWWKRHQKMSALCWKRTLQSKPQRARFGNWESFWYERHWHAADGGRARAAERWRNTNEQDELLRWHGCCVSKPLSTHNAGTDARWRARTKAHLCVFAVTRIWDLRSDSDSEGAWICVRVGVCWVIQTVL